MAKVYGAAGEHAAQQSVAAFKKMFLTLTAGIATLTFALGVVWTLLFTAPTHWLVGLFGTFGFVAGAGWLTRTLNRRVDKYESDRMSWRMGALGECEVAAELDRLSDKFTVFNNVNTTRGNLDHVVVGPTGLFVLETKNWTGTIAATDDGELTKNGKPATAAHVRNCLSRAMTLLEQIVTLTRLEGLRFRAVMVFPKAHVDASYGSTRSAHCVRLNKLLDYIEQAKFSSRLTNREIERVVRALHGIAAMDVDFAENAPAAATPTADEPSLAGAAAVS